MAKAGIASTPDDPEMQAFLGRLGRDYLLDFQTDTIEKHLAAAKQLSAEKPVAFLPAPLVDGAVECTILAFDHPFEFSCITGLLAGSGFSIERSTAFTLNRVGTPLTVREILKRGKRAIRRRDPMKDPLILDHFRGRLVGPVVDFKKWAKSFEQSLLEVMRLLDDEDPQSTDRAKRLVNERVTQWLKDRRDPGERAMRFAPIDVAIDPLPHATRLRLRAPDAPAFLYALSTALSLHKMLIEKTRVQTIDGQAIDEIEIVDAHHKPLSGDDRVQQLRLSVLLTQRFAYFLDRAPDPFAALQRFEELSEKIAQMQQREQWLSLLADPISMSDLAKVLGASEFLWEDFIRSGADVLLPALQRRALGQAICPPSRTLPRRLEEALAGAKSLDEMRVRLNNFKDGELFLIDLDHILTVENLDRAFQILSERLVLLAENLVSAAARFVFAELLRKHGKPKDERGNDVGYAIFGLGKLGGVALGYASDIELLFLFDSDGKTAGGKSGALANGEFFALLTRDTCDSIHAKREGIFRVDLRLRPFGKSGPLASSREQFAQYYGPGGKAHPFEQLALVRLRWIAGDARLGAAIERLRDQFVYESGDLDLDAIWEISGKMRAQHLQGKKLNSKHSPGALADLESTVQLLQVIHASDAPQLRTPRLHEAIQSLRRAGILSPAEFESLMAAYQFLRRVINAQRVLRGSAEDLFLPNADSDELKHLARRMQIDEGSSLLNDFQRHTKAVRDFIKTRFRRPTPGEVVR